MDGWFFARRRDEFLVKSPGYSKVTTMITLVGFYNCAIIFQNEPEIHKADIQVKNALKKYHSR